MKNHISRHALKKILSYDKKTGNFHWNRNGRLAGGIHSSGYICINIGKKMYQAHRLAWLYVIGKIPKEIIDHINCVRTDNRFKNLREASRAENAANSFLKRSIRYLPDGTFTMCVLGRSYGPFNSLNEAREKKSDIISMIKPLAVTTRKAEWRCLTKSRVRKLFSYNSRTGILTWKVNKGGTARIGSRAGHIRADGYARVNVDGHLHYVHRLAWIYVYGDKPLCQIDHIDNNPRNNSFSNLRLATPTQNMANQKLRKDNVSRRKGVTLLPDGTYVSAIHKSKQKIVLGYFRNIDEASECYEKASKKIFGEFARAA